VMEKSQDYYNDAQNTLVDNPNDPNITYKDVTDTNDKKFDLLEEAADTIISVLDIVYPSPEPQDLLDSPTLDVIDGVDDAVKVHDTFLNLLDPDRDPEGDPKERLDVDKGSSKDPNEIVGPGGVGDDRWLHIDELLPYTICFENLTNATLPAQGVHVTSYLDTDLDWSAFHWTGYAVGTQQVDITGNPQQYSGRLDMRGAYGLYVDVSGALNPSNGLITWDLVSIDPATGLPTEDPLAGFLPPNTNPPTGEGWVSYAIRIRDEMLSGTNLEAEAEIVFDVNEPIDTNSHTNRTDATAPTSSVDALPARSPRPIPLTVSASDDHSGVASYDLHVSRLGGAYTKWRVAETNPSLALAAEPGVDYRFYSVARDAVGNVEAVPLAPDASTITEHWITAATQGVGGVILRWESASNRVYSIAEHTSLLSGPVSVLASNLPASPPQNTHTVRVDGASQRFYRISIED